MFADDELIAISALQHWIYCPRQAALIHLEQEWHDNADTAHGHLVHAKTDSGIDETRDGERIVRSLPLVSKRYGLRGISDVVGFTPPLGISPATISNILDGFRRQGAPLPQAWSVYPIEYKRGRPKAHAADHIQLAAQAMCLEDMLNTKIERGELFYHAIRRREVVAIDAELREQVHQAVAGMQHILQNNHTPPPRHDDRCKRCSLKDSCLPQARPSAAQWFTNRLNHSLGSESS
jgi:CRISPR-associated exonuclease Cas4